MKTCSVCDESKVVTEFYPSGDGRQSRCKPCATTYNRGWSSRKRFWETIPNGPSVRVRSEDELRMALNDPYPFYAEPRR